MLLVSANGPDVSDELIVVRICVGVVKVQPVPDAMPPPTIRLAGSVNTGSVMLGLKPATSTMLAPLSAKALLDTLMPLASVWPAKMV